MNILCELAAVSRSGYYQWLLHADLPDKDREDYLQINEVFDQGRGRWGWRAIKMRLPHMNHKKIQRIMRTYELITIVRRRNPYKAIMKKSREHRTFPNKLQREFRQITPHKVFCTDITYLRFLGSFVYLSVVKDIASGEVIAWHLSRSLDMTLVIETLKAIDLGSCENVMIHSDQGFHYTNPTYIAMVSELHMIQSMSGKGNCIDNAPIESFFGHLKDELDYTSAASFEELRLKVDAYMRYYNYERKQWDRKKMTPVEYREYLLTK